MKKKPINDFQKAWNRSALTIKRQCLNLTRDRFAADDLFHDTWLRAFSHWKKRPVAETTLTSTYFTRIAKHAFIDQYRKANRTTGLYDTEQLGPTENTSSELTYLIEPLMLHLTKKQLGIFLLADVFKWKLSDIAAATNTTVGSIKAALFRARQNICKNVRQHINEKCTLTNEDLLHVQLIATALSNEDSLLLIQLINGTASTVTLYNQNSHMLSPRACAA
ncbi:RNA polymerase sigma factor [Bacillus sp. JCM 19041]|uniref:RNA polymerase sigma factor n=1 Tax=Bacillus sp. JCM 19041 TaxID=1460637 RepID=UPI0006D0D645